MCQCCFCSGDWFRSIICLRKAKEDRSKKVKVHSTTEKSNGCEGSSSTHIEPDSPGNGEIQRNNGVPANEERQRSNGVPGMSAEYKAAIRIQTAFRTYMARKSLRRLKGAVRFNVLVQGNDTQKQASSTLSHIHSWSYIQAQIKARRHHMVTDGRIKQKKLENQLKLEAKLQELEVEWNGGSDTMEEILCRIQQREEAAVKRERAMAYAFSHQWRANPTQYLGQAYYSIGKENWGWSWKERWIAARPWEIRVHAQPSYPKKGHSTQASKSEMKVTIRP
ncbi:protein IQ-DOMAIN 10 [Ricinus communis]|uniref:Calmodulin binding protein, putative n=1 Tax=Ricinus communis TaxID=3988 RepID=B9S0P1_RICCO|nr:protein IQ-DOMAIN 10 [Ricinus communis]EEF42809.1 calmodulin binding protein, putative [Ricinus communis]